MKNQRFNLVFWLGVMGALCWMLQGIFIAHETISEQHTVTFKKPWLYVVQKSDLLKEQCELMDSAALFSPDVNQHVFLRSPVSSFYEMMLEPERLKISINPEDFSMNKAEAQEARYSGFSVGAFEWQWISALGKTAGTFGGNRAVLMKWKSLIGRERFAEVECLSISGEPDVWQGAIFESFSSESGEWSEPFCIKSSGSSQWDLVLSQKIKEKTQSWNKPYAYYRFEFIP